MSIRETFGETTCIDPAFTLLLSFSFLLSLFFGSLRWRKQA